MKRFTVPCDFSGQKAPFHIYIGAPAPRIHPLQNQAHWLSTERGGMIPSEIMESFEKLHALAKEHNTSYEDLCVYALNQNQISAEEVKPDSLSRLDKTDVLKASAAAKKNKTNVKQRQPLSPDNLAKKTPSETAQHIFGTAKLFWPENNELDGVSRSLFLGLGLYAAVAPNKELTLREIYRGITCDDPSYAMAVCLDTVGKFIIPLGYNLIVQWINCERWLRERSIFHMTNALVNFAMDTPKSTKDKFQVHRKLLREEMLGEAKP